MIRESISKLVDGQSLSRDEAYETLKEVMTGEATPAQIASFITALRIQGETPDVIAGCAAAMREQFTDVEPHSDRAVDTCGTGGDHSNTFNISTASALVTAGAGITVAKHGNKSVSSKSGSADVLEALGVNIGVAPETMSECLKEIRIAFLFAPALHPAMKHAIGPRREIGIRTIFNILGPLSNPARARFGVLGVYDKDLVPVMAEAATALGAEHLFIVHGLDGLDEITTTTNSVIGEVKQGAFSVREISPGDAGLETAKPEDLVGGEPADNAEIIKAVLAGEQGPRRDIVLINAAAAIVAGGQAETLSDGVEKAAESIDSGAAQAKLDALIERTNA